MTAAAPIMVRAAITQEEWLALRKLALDRKQTTSSLIADAIRAHLLPERKAK